MRYVKLNKNWDAEPEMEPGIEEVDEDLELSFFLDAEEYEHIDKDDEGTLRFNNVMAYAQTPCTKDEYLNGQHRFKPAQVPWGGFYELFDSKWEKHFPENKTVLDDTINKKKIKHYLFFFSEDVFECLASDFEFSFNNTVDDLLDAKYPKAYLNYYLSMFAANFTNPGMENFTIYTSLYLQMESEKEFTDLKAELKRIKANGDLPLYLKFANQLQIENFGMKQLEEMCKVIENHKPDNGKKRKR